MRTTFFQRGGAWVLAQFVLMGMVFGLGLGFRGEELRAVPTLAAVCLLLGGAVVGVAGARVLGQNRTPFPKPREGARCVQQGIYGHVRHPLYTSILLLALAWSLFWQSVPACITALVLIPFFQAKARREECWLRETFSDYADYQRRVPRFVPRLWPRK